MVSPEEAGLHETPAHDTYLDHAETVWIGDKWDVAKVGVRRFEVYRKGNWRLTVGTLELAVAIVQDDEGAVRS
jgi:hypothetical protein